MRLLVIVFALTIACAVPLMAAETCPPGTTPSATGAGPSPSITMAGDEIMDNCLVQAFNITNDQLTSFRSQGLSNSDLYIASAIARKTNQPITNVIAQYQTSRNWNDVATSNNTTLNDLGISPAAVGASNDAFNGSFISQYYGIPMSDVQSLRTQGYSWGEISLVANAASRTGQPISQIATLRSQGMSWSDIATRYNIASSELAAPCPPRTVNPTRLPTCPGIGAGPVCTRPISPVMYDKVGNVLLTEDEALRYYSMGNDWMNVAIAANISRETGYPIPLILNSLRQGETWEMVALNYGVAPSRAFNLTNYPFPHRSMYSESTEQKNLERIQEYQVATNVYGPQPMSTIGLPGTSGAYPMGAPANAGSGPNDYNP